MTHDEFLKLKADRQIREAAIDFLEEEWNARFHPAKFSRASVRKFFGEGLPVEKVFEAIDAIDWKAAQDPSLASDPTGLWQYFCGTCWNMINGVVLVS